MSDLILGLVDGESCNRNKCKGVMKTVDDDSSCSCHINPPCSHCTDKEFECDACGFLVERPDYTPSYKSEPYVPIKVKSIDERYQELDKTNFGYVTITGEYYWMEYKGYCSDMTKEQVEEKFNTCFGCKWLSFGGGKFHLKVYTD